jgi:menaquinone-dependent protoporphyrinogen oxidase
MSRVIVAYATKHGATAEIAEAVADQLRQEGHAVDCAPSGLGH